jgi:bifunctional NMN adenylyltransferase/nudix hydrolase
MNSTKNEVGIIIGRFQTNRLTRMHEYIIDTVRDKHSRTIIFIGESPIVGTFKNPIPYRYRAMFMQKHYPHLEIYPLYDNPSDIAWSNTLDSTISKLLQPNQTAILYGSRDSFIPHYSGKFKTVELESPNEGISATEIREDIVMNYRNVNSDFLAGMIAATAFRYPTAFQAVDICIVDEAKSQVLMGKKAGSTKWQFIGGFSDPTSKSLEEDAKREVREEANVEVDDIKYISSTLINNWRYRDGPDKIKTALFIAKYIFGAPKAGDDIVDVKWIPLENLFSEMDELVVDEHHELVEMLERYYNNNQ